MAYEQRVIDEVQAASDIVDIIGQYLPLKRAGRNLKATCPFHQEKTPSFMVNPEKQIFHCFGCGAGGNVFSFLMRYENLNFPETIRQLAERADIRLPVEEKRRDERAGEGEKMYEIYQQATDYYYACFKDPVKGRLAREYFQKREFEISLADEMKIGWAPDQWQELYEFLRKKRFDETLLLRSGLISRSSHGNCYDTFRGRLIFPVQNIRGKVVAFGGRLLQEREGPKYLNSPENPIFQKRKELFGISFAKKHIDRDYPRMILVEGYFDFLRLYQKGFKTTVATLGTALTNTHVQLLQRFVDEAIVIYDGDKAGEDASLRGLEVFLEGGMSVKLARMPVGLDPDDFLRKNPKEAMDQILASSLDFFDYKLAVLLSRYNRGDSLGLIKITNDFLDTFVKVKNPILLDRYLKRLAASLGVEENSLRSELAKLKKKSGAYGKKTRENEKRAQSSSTYNKNEIVLLGLSIEDEQVLKRALDLLGEDDLQSLWARQIFHQLVDLFQRGEPVSWARVLNRIEDEALKQELIETSLVDWKDEDKLKAFEDCLNQVRKKRVDQKLNELRRNIARAEREGDQIRIDDFIKEYQNLLKLSQQNSF